MQMNESKKIELLERYLEYSSEDLLVEIGRHARQSVMNAAPLSDASHGEGGENWIKKNRKRVCEKLWESEKVASFMRGEKTLTQATVLSTVADIIALQFGVPLAAAATVYLFKTGLTTSCAPFEPES